MKNKSGFTLAEVMVTLTALGVIAAILIPAVLNLAPDRNKIMFRKAYYTLEEVVSQLANDEYHYPAGTTWSSTGDMRPCYLDDNSDIPVDCVFANSTATPDIPDSTKKFCYLLTQRLNIIKTTYSCNYSANTPQFTTSNGVIWYINETNFPIVSGTSASGTTITFDVNQNDTRNCGTAAKPCTDGKTPDMYTVAVRYDGSLEVLSTDGKSYLENPIKNTK